MKKLPFLSLSLQRWSMEAIESECKKCSEGHGLYKQLKEREKEKMLKSLITHAQLHNSIDG